jgi:hypothetical protein
MQIARGLSGGGFLSLSGGIIFIFVVGGCGKKYASVYEAKSTNGMVACICAYQEGLLRNYAADLIVRSANGKTILITNLVSARDAIEDIQIEFSKLKFNGSRIEIKSAHVHYRGPDEFDIPKE